MTIGEDWDDITDPIRAWSLRRRKIAMGTLTLTNVAEDQDATNHKIAFKPCSLLFFLWRPVMSGKTSWLDRFIDHLPETAIFHFVARRILTTYWAWKPPPGLALAVSAQPSKARTTSRT
ncbi:MAG: hypothetical protein GDA40_05475 [Rhodobacteraceae bacterium]|nr:hypothetical protein [Paracoccaceae bacterium]